ncbi:MAG TPA: tail fiber domain-containing protein, partial [Pyrinomonadaceae bacterium]|nr:tail fiber domain-containing protein [Pyrinomonadaceae bacterium]
MRFDVAAPHAAVTLTVIGPDNFSFSKEFKSGNAAEFRLVQAKGERLPDGQYTYELRVTPNFSKEVTNALKAAREKGNEYEVVRDLRKNGALPSQPTVQSGGFMILNGSVVLPGASEGSQARAVVEKPAPQTTAAVYKSRTGYKIQRNHPSLLMFDFVIADDLIVQGSGCFGLDCVDGENFGFDTIRVKENNTRIQFDDTSSSAGFPNNNWQIRANDSGSGGTNFLGFVDQGASGNSETGTIVFAVNSGAAANSIRVGSNSKVGLRTATPVLDMHASTTDTPAIRLEQNNSGGFTAQTWDVAGNEANFFVRDVTAGSRLPFRIRPGAPTSSIDIAASGNVGVGTASPSTRMDIRSADAATASMGSVANSDATRFLTFYSGRSDNNGAALIWDTNQPLRIGNGDIAGAVSFTEWARFTTAGRLGIGTTAPDSLLTVNGTASKPGGGSWNSFSDVRLKNIRGKFNTGLSAVMQLQPLRYQYRPNNAMGLNSASEHVGFSAQDVQKVIPQAVTQSESGYLMVNNDPIIWTMLNAIKEQQKEIVELKQQIRQLRATRR